MRLAPKFVLSHFAIGAFIAVFTLLAASVTHTRLSRTSNFHSASLYAAQDLNGIATAGSEECFAYIVSADVREKQQFLTTIGDFDARTREFAASGKARGTESAKEARLLAEATAAHRAMVQAAMNMFAVFEERGKVDGPAFLAMEAKSDALNDVLREFVDYEKTEVDTAQRDAADALRFSVIALFGVTILAIAASVLVGTLFGRRIAETLRDLQRAAVSLAGGEFDVVIPVRRQDEIGDLARTFGKMAESLRQLNEELESRVAARTSELSEVNRALEAEIGERKIAAAALLRSEEQLRQSQKMDALGRLAGGIAHDFNNMLSVILSYSGMLKEDVGLDSSVREDLREIEKAGRRAAEMTNQLLAFTRKQVLAPKIVDINVLVMGTEKMLRRVIGEHVHVRTVMSSRIGTVRVDAGQIEQVIMNLAVNARDAMPDGGTLTIETSAIELDETNTVDEPGTTRGPHILLAVTDTGSGMDKATLSRIFEPFYTTKDTGKGTGLGLATVIGIVQQSGGSIRAESEPGLGSSFKIYLPVSREESGAVPVSPSERPALKGTETILLVEDEEQVRVLARQILERSGYKVIAAENGEEALKLYKGLSVSVDLIVTDVVMPRMGGRELVTRAAAIRSDMRVLFMSGYTDDAVFHHGRLGVGVTFLQKPLTRETLTRKVREALDRVA